MMAKKQFKINEHLALKLEKNKTNIYIKGKLFLSCKYLLMNFNEEKIKFSDSIDSLFDNNKFQEEPIDQNNDELNSVETEFWAHCSNLHAWVENNYDTRLLHSNLSFPLLKKLTESGDKIAKKVFKEQIAKRIRMGNDSTIKFLILENYLKFLNKEERIFALEKLDSLDLSNSGIEKFPFGILEAKNLLDLCLDSNNLFRFPKNINLLNSLQKLSISSNKINSLPESIFLLENLEYFDCSDNSLKEVHSRFIKWDNLKSLDISMNYFDKFPFLICNLESLSQLNVSNNNITAIPSFIKNLKNLKYFDLSQNSIKLLPKQVSNLKNLRTLILSGNKLKKIESNIQNLHDLKVLYIDNNPLSTNLEWITTLESLEYLRIDKSQLMYLFKDRIYNEEKKYPFKIGIIHQI
ncbi:MAG: hypothetical protein GF311_26330 [Candidatus Lokiarchaeota archaeon]|nr:hypothetical protein [Candidatus Lokiarchaeota archaeon]